MVLKSNEVRLLYEDMPRPNGIALSPDESVLYVSNSGSLNPNDVAEAGPSYVLAFDIEYDINGDPVRIHNPRTVVDFTTTHSHLVRGELTVDGLAVDALGHLFVAGPGGVFVFDESLQYMGAIVTGTRVGNVAIGSDHTLYVCAHRVVFRIVMNDQILPVIQTEHAWRLWQN
jgi:gluconolactonase